MNVQDNLQPLIDAAPTTKEKLFCAGLQLFAEKGYANVGIRELTRAVGIKESSFYNHYAGKKSLFAAILAFYDQASRAVVLSQEEIDYFIQTGDVKTVFMQTMQRFSESTSNRLFQTAQQIIRTESLLSTAAAKLAKRNLYHQRRDYTEAILRGLMEQGAIVPCDVEAVTAEYYYAMEGLLNEYRLEELLGEDKAAIEHRIHAHIQFFTKLLTPQQDGKHDE